MCIREVCVLERGAYQGVPVCVNITPVCNILHEMDLDLDLDLDLLK